MKQEGCDDMLVGAVQAENTRLRKALRDIAEGCSFPEDDVQRAVRDRARAALEGQEGKV